MTDRETESVRSDEAAEREATVSEASASAGSIADEQADSFFAVGDAGPMTGEPAIGGGRAHARIVEAAVVPVEDVPTDYPWELRTESALALTVEFPGGTQAVTYVEYRENGQDPRLARVLEVAGPRYGSYADLYGERLLFEVVDGYWVPYVPPSGPRGSPVGAYGVWFGLAFNALAIAGVVLAGGSLLASQALFLSVLLSFLLVNLLLVPAATLADAWYLESHTDWDHAPLFWASCNAVPLLNVPVSAWYLATRMGVRSIDGR